MITAAAPMNTATLPGSESITESARGAVVQQHMTPSYRRAVPSLELPHFGGRVGASVLGLRMSRWQ